MNDLSDLFDSSQGELLEGELSEIQDVNDLVSSIKSSPLRKLLVSPQKTIQVNSQDNMQYLHANPVKRTLQFQVNDENQYNATSSGYLSDITLTQSDLSIISPVKTYDEFVEKTSKFGSQQVNIKTM